MKMSRTIIASILLLCYTCAVLELPALIRPSLAFAQNLPLHSQPRLAILGFQSEEPLREDTQIVILSLQRELQKSPTYTVIDFETVQASFEESQVDSLINEGIAYFNSIQFDQAIQRLNKARNILEADGTKLVNSEMLMNLHIYLGIIYLIKNFRIQAVNEFKEVIKINPNKQLDANFFSPDVIGVFNSVKEECLAFPKVPVKIDSVPTGAKVYVNGFLKGQTPLAMENFMPGTHYLLLEKEGYEKWSQQFSVDLNSPLAINAKLSKIDEFRRAILVGEKLQADFILTGALVYANGEYTIQTTMINVMERNSWQLPKISSIALTNVAEQLAQNILTGWGRLFGVVLPPTPKSTALPASSNPPKTKPKKWYETPWSYGGAGILIGVVTTIALVWPKLNSSGNGTPDDPNPGSNDQYSDIEVSW